MKQRLAIAQAMLGMPELLILDEPTNGLDPPQIFALRGVLRRYAESGRTVIVSSHLLGEVEQTCSDVVVMARGRLVAKGTVAELAGETSELTIEVTDAAAAVLAIERLEGAEASITASGTLRVLPAGHSPEDVVEALVAAGIGVRSVARGRHLEETFLEMVGTEGII
jgi:ABC-2 type transport system ATP-binding protein